MNNLKSEELVTFVSEVFITTLKKTGYVEKQRLTDEILRVFEFNGITKMKYTHPALDKVFNNLGLVSTLETSNAFSYKS
mgnify:FL=1